MLHWERATHAASGRLFDRGVDVHPAASIPVRRERYEPLRGRVPTRFWRLIANVTRERSFEVLPLYYAMDLDSPAHDHELHALACILEDGKLDDIFTWWEIVAQYPEGLRAALLDHLQEGERYKLPAGQFALEVIRQLPQHSSEDYLGSYIDPVLKGGASGVRVSLMEDWFQAFFREGRFAAIPTSPDWLPYPEDRMAALTGDPDFLRDYWYWNGEPETWLEDPSLDTLPLEQRKRFIQTRYNDRREAGFWINSALFRRLVSTGLVAGEPLRVLGNFVEALGSAAQLETAPERSFQALVKECRWSNGTELVSLGLRRLAKLSPALAAEAFHRFPKQFFATARTCGAVHQDRLAQILRPVLAEPLFEARQWDAVALDNLLTSRRDLAVKLPLFAQWDLHFSGARVLKPAAAGNMTARMHEQLTLLRLWTVDEAIVRALAIGAARPVDRHALLLSASRMRNHRQLRRFFRSPLPLEDYVLSHESTRRWLRKHPGLRLDAWRNGVTLEFKIEGRDPVRLAMEREPNEILKLGTYAGSCLGLGGVNQFSAAAVLLDVNKRVIFARDPRGAFVARQIVAIDKEGRLAAYSVYPHSAPAAVTAAFAEYVHVLAWTCGLRLLRGGWDERGAEVEPVIASGWYDDGAWDPLETESEACLDAA
jgi:hypothetical protein